MPKSKNNKAEASKTAWRSPVKLPTVTAEDEPMKSLYSSVAEKPPLPQVNDFIAAASAAAAADTGADESEYQNLKEEHSAEKINQSPKEFPLGTTADIIETKKANQSVSPKRKTETEKHNLYGKPAEIDSAKLNDSVKLGEAAFLRLLKTERMDFYSLAEILRGSSMALYCVLYSESLAKGENRCQIRQSELMMRAGINNPATLYKQERWLTVLNLISKSVRSGNHSGASYEVRPLEILPLPNHILNQFDGYLIELTGEN